MTMIELALSLQSQGFTILPVNPSTKAAFTQNWTNKADKGEPGSSKDPDQLRAWWEQWPQACVGLRCGKINGFVVVDVDKHGVRTGSRRSGHSRTSTQRRRLPCLRPVMGITSTMPIPAN